jgi:hypothetical protein
MRRQLISIFGAKIDLRGGAGRVVIFLKREVQFNPVAPGDGEASLGD